ncbi:abc1 family protein [Heliomicrobium modesticaldum Ice1]|uniref:Abc1 family protein n=1 Tax=Heliobacterium modesticaldum (strain ATCC 51547 / Ice1) TaxID=498761 RepID=B0TBN7_HELMI|nr:AarF/UbiB family protein [Heliomicrobium modesticaldum]ABZ83876.1 abc1 family protein [Heliomicrobium modesticaldum Ice1]
MNRYYRIWRITSMFVLFFIQFWWLKRREGRLDREERERRWSSLYHRMGIRFCVTATELGGLLIKAGQFFATRVDVLPVEVTSELSQLQDAVPPAPFEHIEKTIREELGLPAEAIFSQMDSTPLAAASLGQVHRAVLPTGEQVAVKVLRPRIHEIIQADFEAIQLTMLLAKVFTDISSQMDMDAIYREMRQTFSDELDYRLEAAHAERFRKNLSVFENVYIPKIYSKYSTRRILTMEFIDGRKVDDYAFLEANGIDRKEMGHRLIRLFLHMIVNDGFFHADPHQGNLYVKADGTLVVLDFGMVGEITPLTKENLKNLLFSVVERDSEKMVEAMGNLGFLRPTANRNLVRRAMEFFLEHHSPEQLKEMERTKNLGPLGAEIREFIYDQPMQIPAHMIFLGRAVLTVTGVAFGLDRDMDAEVAAPYIKKLMDDTDGGLAKMLLNRAKGYGATLIGLPTLMHRTLKKADLGDLHVKVSNLGDIQRGVMFQSRLANRIVLAILTSTSLICATIFYTQHFFVEAEAAALIGALFGALLLWSSRQKPRDSSQPLNRYGPF